MSINNDNTRGVTGCCLEVNDLAISKYVAGREKDLHFTSCLAKAKLTDREALNARVEQTEIEEELKNLVQTRISKDFSSDQIEVISPIQDPSSKVTAYKITVSKKSGDSLVDQTPTPETSPGRHPRSSFSG